ncbi:hypothetical protein EMWEY_00059320 [Eimeria maxima]|uniref:Uncharacterized protein n=1 Tax=Eimeria maxima TaxID=5804 RepID=U6MA29_EIMMA|nr:hypothetical protein EMWEY_00059320 [Eimeria maxima]CDJ59908.1 hypothetical protein EMWEY_00059320 [Eimeria maxima]
MLAEGFPHRQLPGQRPVLQLLSDGKDGCGSAGEGRPLSRRHRGEQQGLSLGSRDEAEQHYTKRGAEGSSGEASQIPSSVVAGSDGFDDRTSSAHPTGPRVKHDPSVALRFPGSPHYKNLKKPYNFPLIGRETRYERLHAGLKKLEEVMDGLCFPHDGPYQSEATFSTIHQ